MEYGIGGVCLEDNKQRVLALGKRFLGQPGLIYLVHAIIAYQVALMIWQSKFYRIIIPGAIVVALVFIWPYLGLLTAVSAIPLDVLATVSGSLTYTRFLGILALAAFLHLCLLKPRKLLADPTVVVGFFFCLWCCSTLLWAPDLKLSFDLLPTLAQLVLFYWLIINLVDRSWKAELLLGAFVLGCVITAIVSIIYFDPAQMLRAALEGQNPNTLGKILAMGLMMAIYGFSRWRSPMVRFLLLPVFPLLVIGIILSVSRAAWLGLGVGFLAAALSSGSRRMVRLVTIGVLVLIAILVLVNLLQGLGLLGEFFEYRLSTMTLAGIIENRGDGRFDIWLVGLNIIGHHPLLGMGLGNFPVGYNLLIDQTPGQVVRLGPSRMAHNSYLDVLAETGPVGLLLFIWILATAFKNARRNPDSAQRMLGMAILSFIVLDVFFNIGHYTKIFWLGLAIPAILLRTGHDRDADPRPAACPLQKQEPDGTGGPFIGAGEGAG